jgi:transcriptional regulator with AAA-type ATPase domain/tetratricopeptide (TPR) repeat protein
MDPLAELVGESATFDAVRAQIRRLLARREKGRRLPSILLTGETGSGKGLVARTIHRAGPRASGPFVDVNCAAIPENLLEAELFGFERGAFTDARRSKSGLFQTANRGTIFLDEVGLLPEALQAKLLKVLEEQAVRRLGATAAEPLDVWIISATNADLQAAVRQRAFREDLYHRLAVLTLMLPPLRERSRDVLILAERFLARVCADYGLPAKRFASDAQARLLAYPWPGNVRELGNVIERVALLAERDVVTADMLDLQPGSAGAPPRPADSGGPPAVTLDDAMRDHVLAALTQTAWNISRTAALLGISRNTLRARIAKLGLRAGSVPAGPPPRAKQSPPLSAPDRPAAPSFAPASPLPVRWEQRRVSFVRAALVVPEGNEAHSDAARGLETIIDKARSFGGRIDEVSAKGIGVVFGLEPTEDAPLRAAHASMAMQKAAERAREDGGERFALRIAVHVGNVMVARAGSDAEIDGDAKRAEWLVIEALLGASAPGTTVVSPPAAVFLQRRFKLEPLDAAHGDRTAGFTMSRVDGLRVGPDSPVATFVGRGQELEFLRSRLESTRAGNAQMVGIVGDAGMGKSRLLEEFRHSLRGESVTYVQGHCLSFGSNIPYLPVFEILRQACRLRETETPEAVARKVGALLTRLDMPDGESRARVLHFLGIKAGTETRAAMGPDAIQRRTYETLRRMCAQSALQRPLVIAVEDIHWIDSASEALGALIAGLGTIPLLLIVTYRPGHRPAWLERPRVTQIALQPLSPQDSLSVVRAVAPLERIASPVVEAILARAEGNPFFLEELARAVAEAEGQADTPVPETIQDVLLARINRLGDNARGLAQTASILGREASPELLSALWHEPGEIEPALQELVRLELLYERAGSDEPAYVFRHALIQDVAYASLGAARRRELHGRAVRAIESTYGDALDEHTEQLARHAVSGEEWSKAVPYLRAAGARAFARSANREAAAYFEQALAALAQLPPTAATRLESIDVRLDLRNALTPLGEVARTLAHLREAEAAAAQIGDQRRRGRALSFATNCLYLGGDYPAAVASGKEAGVIAESLKDFPLTTATDMYLGRAHHALGDYRAAIGTFRRIVASLTGDLMREHLGLPVLPAVFSRSLLVQCLAEVGAFAEGLEHAEEGVRLARETTHPDTMLWAYRGLGLLHLMRGEAERAEAVLDQALSLCRTHDLPVYLTRVTSELALAHAMRGRARDAVRPLEQAVQEATERNQAASLPQMRLFLAETYLLAELFEEARAAGAQALDLSRAQQDRGHEAHALRLLADVAAGGMGSDVEAAAQLYGEADTVARELGMRPLSARCHLGLGLLRQRNQMRDEALRHLSDASRELDEMGMTLWLDPARAALDRLR